METRLFMTRGRHTASTKNGPNTQQLLCRKWKTPQLSLYQTKMPPICSWDQFFRGRELFVTKKEPKTWPTNCFHNITFESATYYGTNSVHSRGPLFWNNLHSSIKSSNSLFEFKNKIKSLRKADWESLIFW